jgi:L-ribulose-5-phosphate 3-epimerase
MERRTFLHQAAAFSMLPILNKFNGLDFKEKKIGACDWSLGKNAKVEALDVAKAIGLAGVQVNLGDVSNNLHVRQKEIQQSYLKKSNETKVKITSIAIGELNNVPYKSDDRTDQWVHDSVDVAKAFDVPVILLAFFAKNDLRNDKKGIDTVIQKLKDVAPYAEKHKKIFGIESYLTAEEHLHIMDKVGSEAVKVYYDFRNAKDAGNDIFKEMKLLGNENICELHLKENRVYLGKGDINWSDVNNALDKLGFSRKKWSQIEWSLPDGIDYVQGHKQNFNFINSLKK